jgi:hypothetical protein
LASIVQVSLNKFKDSDELRAVMATEELLALQIALHGQDGAVDHGESLCNLYNAVAMSWMQAGVYVHHT